MKRKSCILAAAMVVSTAMVAMAQERTVTPYASIRYFIGAYYQNKDFVRYSESDPTAKGDVDMLNSLSPTSRLGIRFQNGNLKGQFEIRGRGGHVGNVALRQAWGEYSFDFGLKILAGNTDAPWYVPVSSEAWDIYGGPGATMGDRAPRIKISFAGLGTPASFAYVDLQRSPNAPIGGADTGYYNNDPSFKGQDVHMPLATVGYEYKSDVADIGLGFTGYRYSVKNTYKMDSAYAGLDKNMRVYMGFIHGTIKLGGPYIKFNASYEKSPYLLGISNIAQYWNASPTHSLLNDCEKLSDAFLEGLVEIGYKSSAFGFSATVGYMRNMSGDNHADRIAYGVNIDIPLAPGFKAVPTFYWLDERKDADKEKQGADCLALLKLQYDL